ncbi:MAG: hypothetical protein ACTSRZ_11495 [Promethearchaeota archaeon]
MSENYHVKDLIDKMSAMNQMRNNIYHLVKFMQEKGFSNEEIRKRLKRMGRNIANTMNTIFKFEENNAESTIKKIYKTLLNSKITVSRDRNMLIVEDRNCALCKYHRKDIMVSPDTIIPAMITEIMSHNGYKIIDGGVSASKSLGDPICIHKYEFMEGSF